MPPASIIAVEVESRAGHGAVRAAIADAGRRCALDGVAAELEQGDGTFRVMVVGLALGSSAPGSKCWR